MIHTITIIGAIDISIYVVNVQELNGQKEKDINAENQYVGDGLRCIGKILYDIYDDEKSAPDNKEHFEIFQGRKIFRSTRTGTQTV